MRRTVDETLQAEIEEAIIKFCILIARNPMCYFSEADLQQVLLEHLRSIPKLDKLHKTNQTAGKNSKKKYRTSLLHREYGGGNKTRFDIAVLRRDDVAKIDSPALKLNDKYLTPAFGFELGTEKTSKIMQHYQNDLKKLRKCDRGYLIHIFKDVTTTRKNTGRNANTEAAIQQKFKSVFEKHPAKGNTVVIAILLRPFKNERTPRGKLEIFDGRVWQPVNVGSKPKIRKAIRELL